MGSCYNSITISAPADKVWATIRNFHELGWAAGVVDKLDAVGDVTGENVGAQRVLNDAFHETLRSLDEASRSFTYSIDDGPGPVAKDAIKNYVGSVKVFPITADDSTFVEWASSYDSSDSSAVGELCDPIYQALLGAMKKNIEG